MYTVHSAPENSHPRYLEVNYTVLHKRHHTTESLANDPEYNWKVNQHQAGSVLSSLFGSSSTAMEEEKTNMENCGKGLLFETKLGARTLLVTSATLLVTSALLVVTSSY